MNLDLSQDQEMMRETFARFLNENSSPARVRAALPGGFDRALWTGLAELGAFSLRVPASHVPGADEPDPADVHASRFPIALPTD